MPTVKRANQYTYYAFFDVDGTIINTRSVLSFLDYLQQHARLIDAAAIQFYNQLYQKLANKEPREEINRYYYTFYRDKSVADIKQLAAQWFACNEQKPDFYNYSILNTIEEHAQAGAGIILVTGSFYTLLQSLHNKIHFEYMLCSELEEHKGVFTGRLIGEPCIGEGKARALLSFTRSNAIDLKRCYAYGDDHTDLPMLSLVGHPVEVEASPAYHAECAQWGEKRLLMPSPVVCMGSEECG